MFGRPLFLMCVLSTLSTVLLASDEKPLSAPPDSPATETASEPGVPALFSWGDVDGDGRLDLAAVSANGKLRILANASDGRFEDVTERVGLSDVESVALALWADYDGDGRLDLFVGARTGPSRLFHNDAGTVFLDASATSGLSSNGAVQSAQWFDYDGDGRLDLFVATAETNELFRGAVGGRFEMTELPLAGAVIVPVPGGSLVNTPGTGGLLVGTDGLGGMQSNPRSPNGAGGVRPGGSIDVTIGPGPITPGSGGMPPLAAFPAGCAESTRDQATPASCLSASTTPTLGMLYPISSNLFVATGGNVGIGTTSPTAKLHVAGSARVTGTLTLNPAVDQALDISTGSIYKAGALFIHTKGAGANTGVGQLALANNSFTSACTAIGFQALSTNTFGSANTASGASALGLNIDGDFNTASGAGALKSNTTGNDNTASGFQALYFNTGSRNTASGSKALHSTTTGNDNTASGHQALYSNTSGSRNTASGYKALDNNNTGINNTAIGFGALAGNTTGGANTAIGYRALELNTVGSLNTALGRYAGRLTIGNDNIMIGNQGGGESATTRIGTSGTQTRAFIAGIRGVTTGAANAIPVLVDSTGQLGTVSSSRRSKKDIADMGELTERLLELRPVVFHYKQAQTMPGGGEVPLEYGLIAEEVAETFPDLVVYDEEGKPFTVKYHILSSMLLNEMKKMHERLESQGDMHAREMEELRSRLTALESRSSPATLPTVIPAGSR